MVDTAPLSLSKPCLDVGYFTNHADTTLAFWRDEMGLDVEPPVPFNDGLTQYRHALGTSVVKINTARDGVAEAVPSGFAELFIAQAGIDAPRSLHDPDGNIITLVPPDYRGITGIGVRMDVANAQAQTAFLRDVMGFEAHEDGGFSCGHTRLFVEQAASSAAAGHWVNAGFRYVTVHVMRVDESFAAMTAAGAAVGESPYSIGRIARISFVRDPHGNWFEVAQRASLAGPWWTE